MSRGDQIGRLRHLSGLMLDLRLAELRAAARTRQESLDLLAGLGVPQASSLPPVAAAQADLLYRRWVEARRAEINLVLARQTAAWLEAQAAAREAFGRAEALRGLQAKAGGPKSSR